MRFSIVFAILASALVFAAPYEEGQASEELQLGGEIFSAEELGELANFYDTVEIDNLKIPSGVKNALKKGFKIAKKVGKAVLKNGPEIVSTASAIHNELKGDGSSGADAAAQEAAPPA